MAKRVNQTLSDLPIEPKLESVLAFLERELKPIVRRLRESNNELSSTDLTALEAAVDALEVDVADHEVDLADHETRISDLETAIAAAGGWTIHGRGTHVVATNVVYLYPEGRNEGASITGTIADAQLRWADDGEFYEFGIQQLTSSGDADDYTIAVNINGADSALSISDIAGTDTTFHVDTSVVSVADGDLITIARTEESGDMSINDLVWYIKFRPT